MMHSGVTSLGLFEEDGLARGHSIRRPSVRGIALYRSERVAIDECDWTQLDVDSLAGDPAARTMIVLDHGRVLLGSHDYAPWRSVESASCTVFRFFGTEIDRSVERRVQLTPGVLFHFYRRRQALLMHLDAPEAHTEGDSFALLRFVESANALAVIPRLHATCSKDRQLDLVSQAQTLMQAEPGERHTVEEVARRVGASPFHLSHVFRRSVGASMHQYLLHLRLVAALDRLRGGVTDLSKLALELGFSHHSHFSAIFRRVIGTSPREVRRMLNANAADVPLTYRCPGVSAPA